MRTACGQDVAWANAAGGGRIVTEPLPSGRFAKSGDVRFSTTRQAALGPFR